MELVTFKITVLDKRNPANVLETRKFSLPRGSLTLDSMMEAYGSETVLSYRDNDGDWISLRTQADLDEMFRSGPDRESNVIRLQATSGPGAVARLKSLAARVAKDSKQAAEEAIVLGVRGASYVEHRWNNAPAAAAVTAPVAAAAPEASSNAAPVSATSPPSTVTESAHDEEEQEEEEDEPSFVTKIAETGKHIAEEALVLGVRGVSYVEHKWNSAGRIAPAVLSDEEEEEARVEEGKAEEKAAPKHVVMSDSWVNMPSPVVAPVPAAPVPVALPMPVQLKAPAVHKVAVPAPVPAPSDKLEKLLAELHGMGFTDRERNMAALLKSRNSIEDAVASLLGDL